MRGPSWPLLAAIAATGCATPAGIAADPAVADARSRVVVGSFSSLIPIQRAAFADAWSSDPDNPQVDFFAVDRGLAPLRAQVASRAVQWDVVDLNLGDALLACDAGLLEPIDPREIPDPGDLFGGVLTRCAIGNLAWSNLIAWRSPDPSPSARVVPVPRAIADVFDVVRYPGKRALNAYPYMNLERALVAGGVAPARVYAVLGTREGEDRAFAKLASIRDQIVWLGPELRGIDALRDGRVAFAAVNNGSLFRARFELNDQATAAERAGPAAVAAPGAPTMPVLTPLWDGQMWTVDVWAIPKGAPNPSGARAFIAVATSASAQAAQAQATSWGPVRRSSLARIGTHPSLGVPMRDEVVTARRNLRSAVLIDAAFWRAHGARLGERFEREFGIYRAPFAEATSPASRAGARFTDCAGCPEMVVVSPGEYIRGSTPAMTDSERHEEARVRDERPRRNVRIGYPLAVSRTEITRTQFATFARETGFRPKENDCWVKFNGGGGAKAEGRRWDAPGVDGEGIAPYGDDHPVICVGWDDAVAYARWLARRTGMPYRLLTESEWEYVAGGETTPQPETLRPWGNDLDAACRHSNAPDRRVAIVVPGRTIANCDDGHARTAPVGTFAPNGFGLQDTMGNVWEWVQDCWADSYANVPDDGSSAPDTPGCRRGMRGGSWSETSIKFRLAARGKGDVEDRGDSIGIRVAYRIE